MKKRLFVFLSVVLFVSANSQNLSTEIKGKFGITKFYTSVSLNQKIHFSGSSAKSMLALNQEADLVLYRTETDKQGFINYRFYQTYKNYPVENSMYIMQTRNGLLKGLSGFIVTDFDATNMAKRSIVSLDKEAALQAVMRVVQAKEYAWQSEAMEQRIKIEKKDNKATYKPAPGLVWYNSGTQIQPRALRLCYKVDVYATQPLSRAYYFIDAATGELVGKKDEIEFTDAVGTANTAWSGTRTIHSDKTGATDYRLRDLTKGNGVITLHGENAKRGLDYTSTSANWNLTGNDQAAMDAHYGVSQTWLFYDEYLGRNSYDGNGAALYSYVNDPTYIDNAFWDGSAMNFNKRSTGEPGGVTGIDVTGHELTHGVTQETSGLVYAGESGGMNESMSDIFGKCVQFWSKPTDVNWLLSNDMNWIIRDMSNPNAYSQPDTYGGLYWSDFADVHTLSGVGNYMFYLLMTGGKGTNDNGDAYDVTALGFNKTVNILYRSQTEYLVPTSDYKDWRTACIQSAADLYGDTSDAVAQVKNAFYAVGVGPSSTGCDEPTNLAASNITQTSAKLTWSAVPGISKYNLQWKAVTATSWTLVKNITTNSYQLSALTLGTKYEFRVRSICPTGTVSSLSDTFAFITLDKTNNLYCTSNASSTSFEYIQKVQLNNYSNESGDNGGYGYFGLTPVPVQAGATNVLHLTPGFSSSSYDEYWTGYIDYNQDGDFADAGEYLGAIPSFAGEIASGAFIIPTTAKNGFTRLRVQMQYGTPQKDPCAVFTYGETEDYTIKISGATAAFAPQDLVKLNVSPNPAKGYAAASLNLTNTGKVTFKISDVTGRILMTQVADNLQKGKNTIVLNNLSNLTRGVFLLTAEQDGVVIGRVHLLME